MARVNQKEKRKNFILYLYRFNYKTDSIGLVMEEEFDSITRVALLKLEFEKDKYISK